jgi:hypothetical protein
MSATIRFELRLEIDVPVDAGDDPRDWVTQQQKTQLEKEVLKHLKKKLYGEVTDIEVVDATIIDTDPRNDPDYDEAYERAAARYDGEGKDWR